MGPHITVDVFNTLALRAGFYWRDSCTLINSPEENETWDDVLNYTINEYDLALGFWSRTIDRLSSGILYPEPWYDNSLIMFQQKQNKKMKFDFFSFLYPFSAGVWLLIAFTIPVTGLLYYFVECLNNRRTNTVMDISLRDSFFFTYQGLLCHNELKPVSFTSRSILGSLLFLSLVITSSYTANLASFLVNENLILQINDFEDVLSNNFLVCSTRAVGQEIELRKKYPTGNYMLKETKSEVLNAVSVGECRIGVTDYSTFRVYKGDKNYSNCNLEWVGRRIAPHMASFAIKDIKDRCSYILYNVLDIFLIEMMKDGTLDGLWKKQEAKHRDCNENDNPKNEDGRLYVKDLGGVFLLHFIILITSAIAAFYVYKNQKIITTATNVTKPISVTTKKLSTIILGKEEESSGDT